MEDERRKDSADCSLPFLISFSCICCYLCIVFTYNMVCVDLFGYEARYFGWGRRQREKLRLQRLALERLADFPRCDSNSDGNSHDSAQVHHQKRHA